MEIVIHCFWTLNLKIRDIQHTSIRTILGEDSVYTYIPTRNIPCVLVYNRQRRCLKSVFCTKITQS